MTIRYNDIQSFFKNYHNAIKILESLKQYLSETNVHIVKKRFISDKNELKKYNLNDMSFYAKFSDNREFLVTIQGVIYILIDNKIIPVKDNSWREYYES